MDIIEIGKLISSTTLATISTGIMVYLLMDIAKMRKRHKESMKDFKEFDKMFDLVREQGEDIALLEKRTQYCLDCGALRKLKA